MSNIKDHALSVQVYLNEGKYAPMRVNLADVGGPDHEIEAHISMAMSGPFIYLEIKEKGQDSAEIWTVPLQDLLAELVAKVRPDLDESVPRYDPKGK